MRGAVPADRQKACRQIRRPLGLEAFKPFTQGDGNGGSLALTGQIGQFSGQPMGLFTFNVHTHLATILPFDSTMIPRSSESYYLRSPLWKQG